MIRLERAVIGYRTPLLPPIDLAVRAGSTLGVLGPNGAGKTALLKSLLGLLPLFGGRRVLPLGRPPRVGYVPQRDRLDMSWPLRVLDRSEEHTSELQSPCNLVCRLLLEKKKKYRKAKRSSNTTLL